MLDKLFSRFKENDEPAEAPDAQLHRAYAALLVEAARADEEYTDEERTMIDTMLRRKFGFAAAEAHTLREEAEAAQETANDLYGFSRVVKADLSRDEKIDLVTDMWEIALSDSERDPHEDMIIRRLVGLLHLEDTDSTAARKTATARLGL